MLFAIASLTLAATLSPQTVPDGGFVQQADLTLGAGVVNRRAEPLPEKIVAGQLIYAVTESSGSGGGFVEHVWTCNGKEVSHHYLPIGQSKRWRTWSKHKVAAGHYHVEVLGQNGARLQEADFEVVGDGESNSESTK
jgi:hypothetical protein